MSQGLSNDVDIVLIPRRKPQRHNNCPVAPAQPLLTQREIRPAFPVIQTIEPLGVFVSTSSGSLAKELLHTYIDTYSSAL